MFDFKLWLKVFPQDFENKYVLIPYSKPIAPREKTTCHNKCIFLSGMANAVTLMFSYVCRLHVLFMIKECITAAEHVLCCDLLIINNAVCVYHKGYSCLKVFMDV